jgi:hypothetical protein
MEVSDQLHGPAAFPPEKYIPALVGQTAGGGGGGAGLDEMEK